MCPDETGSGQRTVADSCEHGNSPEGSINDAEILDHLSDYRILKKDSSPPVFLFVAYFANADQTSYCWTNAAVVSNTNSNFE
jgi:hypothetical protein